MNLEKLSRAMLIIGDSLQQVTAAAKEMAAALAEIVYKANMISPARALEETVKDVIKPIPQFQDALDELAELVEDMPPLPTTKTPRSPKCLGPVNKANHAASRPPRRARSSCYIRKR